MKNKTISILTFLLLSAMPLLAQPKPTELESFFSNPLLLILGLIAVILLFVIYVMGKVALMAIKKNEIEERKKRKDKKVVSTVAILFFTLLSSSVFASAEPEAASGFSASITSLALCVSLGVILVEVFIVAYLYKIIRRFSGLIVEGQSKEKWKKFLSKLHKLEPIEAEGDMDTGHNYDGIRELDNPPPPWWIWAFVASFIFAVGYMYRYHIAETAPLQIEELEIAMAKGEADKKAYLATAKNAIDETNVVMLESSDISVGAGIFAKNCVACHGANGEGNAVGPNLTDEFWVHEGGMVNIFKSVKYGWPEKGMKSWQDDLSSYEMAQVSSYINSLLGSNPANAKEAQGEIWKEGGATTDGEENPDAEVEATEEDAKES